MTSVLESAVPTVKFENEKSHISKKVKRIWAIAPPITHPAKSELTAGREASETKVTSANHVRAKGNAYKSAPKPHPGHSVQI